MRIPIEMNKMPFLPKQLQKFQPSSVLGYGQKDHVRLLEQTAHFPNQFLPTDGLVDVIMTIGRINHRKIRIYAVQLIASVYK